jgi:hypothetical protein
METKYDIIGKAAAVVVAAGFMTIASALIVLGCTFLPLIGILAALPLMFLSLHILTLNPQVYATAREQTTSANAYLELESFCPWPPLEGFCPWPPGVGRQETA